MKKQTLLVAALLLFSTFAFSQGFVSVSIGSSIPTGDYGDNNLDNDFSGLATVGPAFDLSAGKTLYKKLGFVGTVRYQINSFDESALEDGGSSKVVADSYKAFILAVGPYLEFNIGKNYVLDIKLQGGLYNSKFPAIQITSGAQMTKLHGNSVSSSAILAGFNLRRNLGEKMAIGLTLDYVSASSITYNVTSDSYAGSQLVDSSTDKKELPVSTVNTILTFAYRFGK